MIKMKALASCNMGPYVTARKRAFVSRAREFDAESEHRARELETAGLAFRLPPPAPMREFLAPVAPAENPAAVAGPFDFPGGGIGEEAPAPSLLPDQAPRRRRSHRSRAVQGSPS